HPESNANAKEPVKLKSVLVSQLPQSTVQDDVKKLFKDDSIPGALTKDKKRIHGAEVTVNPAEKTTLWVTNFRDGMDDAEMRGMFEKYVLNGCSRLDINAECYQAAAQAALYLNGFEMEAGMKLTVLVSDPTRKKQRTDAGARELRVTGIVKSVTKADLEKLFGEVSSPFISPRFIFKPGPQHGELKDIRLLPAAGNNQTAFVEYETEEAAQGALALNNHMLKGRRLAVIMADSRPSRPGEEANSRSIRIKGVPSGTQEPILQQALEKVTSVVRLNLIPERNEAILEVENAAVAGKLLLEHPTITFNDQTLTLSEEVRSSAATTRGRGRGRGTFGLSHARQVERQAESVTSPPSSPEVVMGTPRGHRGGRARGGGKVGIGGSRAGIGMKSRKMDTDAGYEDAEMNDREPASASGPGAPAAAVTDRTPKSQADFRQMLGF
ncbi:1626_t:CDS:2, partial [Acaulospora colombiana]